MNEHQRRLTEALISMEPEINKTFGTVGWKYMDFPSMSDELWEQILPVIGEPGVNHHVLATRDFMGEHPATGEVCRWRGGQYLIDPDTFDKIMDFVAAMAAEERATKGEKPS